MDVADLRRTEARAAGTPAPETAEAPEGPRCPDPRLELKDPSGLDPAAVAEAAGARFRATPSWPLVIGHRPAPAPAFRSRDAVRERIARAREGASAVVLVPGQPQGGGVGCTQLAGSVAADAVAAGTDLVLWVDAGAPGAVVEAFARAAVEVQAPGFCGHPAEAEADARAFLAWAADTRRSWLVVLDGIVDPADVEGWWPVSRDGTGWTLATARLRHTRLTAPDRPFLDVDAFTADEAEAYLVERLTGAGAAHLAEPAPVAAPGTAPTGAAAGTGEAARPEPTAGPVHSAGTVPVPGAAPTAGAGAEPVARSGAADLAETLQRLPLALAQAADYLLAEGVACSVYRDRFQQALPRLRDLRPVTDPQERIVAVTTLLALDAAQAHPPAGLARPALDLAAVLDPAGHPSALWATDRVVRHLGEHRTADPATAAPGDGPRGPRWARIRPGRASSAGTDRTARVDEQQSLAAVDLLARYGLVERDDAAGVHVVRMSSLTARAVRDTAPAGSAAPVALVAADALVTVWPDLHHDRADLVALLRANARSVTAAAGGLLWTDDHEHPLLEQVGLDLLHRGLCTAAVGHWQRIAADAAGHLGSQSAAALAAQGNLAVGYWEAGRVGEAIAIEERLAADRLRRLGPDHPDTLAVQTNLAASYRQVGRADEATTLLEKVTVAAGKVLGPEHPSTLTAQANLALSYWQSGRTAEAVTLLERVVANRESVLGPDDPSTLTAHANLAALFWAIGRTEDAVEIEEKEVADHARLFGPRHPSTLTAQANLAASYRRAGRTADAVELLARVVSGRERLLGAEHPDTVLVADALRAWRGQ